MAQIVTIILFSLLLLHNTSYRSLQRYVVCVLRLFLCGEQLIETLCALWVHIAQADDSICTPSSLFYFIIINID